MKITKEIIANRCHELNNLEMKFSFADESYIGKHDYNSDFNVHQTEIITSDETEWNKIISNLSNELKLRK